MSQLLDAIDGVPNACEPIHGIVTGGQPTLEHLAALKRAGGMRVGRRWIGGGKRPRGPPRTQLLAAIAGVPNGCEPIHGIVTGGQPTLEHLAARKRAGGEVVIDLREPMEPQPFRPAAVTKA